jgi:Peptidase family S41
LNDAHSRKGLLNAENSSGRIGLPPNMAPPSAFTGFLLAVAMATIGTTAAAQHRAVASAPPASALVLTSVQRASAIDHICSVLVRSYVSPLDAPKIIGRLEEALTSKRLDAENPGIFAERVNAELSAVSNDEHLYLQYDPARYAAANEAPGLGETDELQSYERHIAIRNHFGLTDTRLLTGNVRYLRVNAFQWVDDQTGAAYDDVMRFLKDGDAIIVDLRGNGGGSHAAVRYLISFFLKPDTLEITIREGTENRPYHALSYLPSGRVIGKPLYVLIDGGTGSAAEAFAYDVQQFHLGELIGSRTAGAANNNQFTPITPAFMLSVPYARPVHAISGNNWEGAGIKPDVDASPEMTLDVAHERALETLAARVEAGAAEHADWEWARDLLIARLHPISLNTDVLRRYVGRYETVEIFVRDNALWMRAGTHPEVRLLPMNDSGMFYADGVDSLRVKLSASRLELIFADEPASRIYTRSRSATS